jgi:transcriptional regulator with XRE-family HTH domain
MDPLKDWMAKADVKDEALAPKLSVSRVHVSRLRRRKCRPSLETAKRLEEITEIPAADFLMVELAR